MKRPLREERPERFTDREWDGLGIDPEKLAHTFHGRNFRLTRIAGEVIEPVLA